MLPHGRLGNHHFVREARGGEIKIPTHDALSMPGYDAKPQGKGLFPTILVVHEIFGVHEYIQDAVSPPRARASTR